jgi:hypothetical protein
MAMTLDASPDEVARLLTQGISRDLESLIKQRLSEQADAIISQLARDLASQLAVNVKSYTQFSGLQGNAVRVQLIFNGADVSYVEGK